MKFQVIITTTEGNEMPTKEIDSDSPMNIEAIKALLADQLFGSANVQNIILKDEKGQIIRKIDVDTDLDRFIALHGGPGGHAR